MNFCSSVHLVSILLLPFCFVQFYNDGDRLALPFLVFSSFHAVFVWSFLVSAGWATIWTGLWAMWMKVFSAVCVETCWSAPSRRPVNMRTAAPASVAGWSITTPVQRTDCRWMLAASNHCTGVSTSLHICVSWIPPSKISNICLWHCSCLWWQVHA